MINSTKIGQIFGNRESAAVLTALFNWTGTKAHRIAVGNQDTNFLYDIYVEHRTLKLSRDKLYRLVSFVDGFKAGCDLYK